MEPLSEVIRARMTDEEVREAFDKEACEHDEPKNRQKVVLGELAISQSAVADQLNPGNQIQECLFRCLECRHIWAEKQENYWFE